MTQQHIIAITPIHANLFSLDFTPKNADISNHIIKYKLNTAKNELHVMVSISEQILDISKNFNPYAVTISVLTTVGEVKLQNHLNNLVLKGIKSKGNYRKNKLLMFTYVWSFENSTLRFFE